LLAVTHGGYIWLDKPVHITVELIAQKIGLPIQGMDPAFFMDDKSKEKEVEEMNWIKNASTQLGTKILACKLLRKCRREEVPVGVIAVAS
jgi:hypothetical protein